MNAPSLPAVALQSKLPDVGVSIFSQMTALAQETGAINLAQGFPDYDPPQALLESLARHARTPGHHQYAPMPGLPRLREAIAAQVARLQPEAPAPDPATEITVTAGATEALYAVLAAVVRPGDEVLVFEPAYDLYGPAIRLQGGVPRYVRLPAPHFRPDWDAVRRVVSARTRLVMVNTPHNPSGAVFTAEDWDALAKLLDGTNALVLSDEVYEHLVFDGAPRLSARQHPALRERSFVLSSFGKTYHATGWKVGYCIAPPALTTEVRRVHQFLTFSVSTPTQHALADALEADPTDAHARGLSGFYQEKRDLFRHLLLDGGWDLLPVPGGYFQLARYDAFSPASDLAFAQFLAREKGVAVVPVSAFYHDGYDEGLIRFCFAKETATLEAAAQRLR
ncbi:methionine aminotransferase [Hymenobacter properus]|uniref:Aminotransferase class I/II-fold pyridoxal phosphate-dependent enzyme n=1 Tax=Hymenobacter properus TaxID=2791026 RepID=A0A931BJN0_9BACT|nr:methionine aminotransferase [Hymenobacter properus]MBF9142567.1 aminotransferase class I/II-fold pyridoxal phosphate-dependent enzyme [Hymenobacter properus]MBR7721374.1 aminotransferase class I/II-fold pyridoxal phosphate-dependent enzyme [Microvirga sp. SRT04]